MAAPDLAAPPRYGRFSMPVIFCKPRISSSPLFSLSASQRWKVPSTKWKIGADIGESLCGCEEGQVRSESSIVVVVVVGKESWEDTERERLGFAFESGKTEEEPRHGCAPDLAAPPRYGRFSMPVIFCKPRISSSPLFFLSARLSAGRFRPRSGRSEPTSENRCAGVRRVRTDGRAHRRGSAKSPAPPSTGEAATAAAGTPETLSGRQSLILKPMTDGGDRPKPYAGFYSYFLLWRCALVEGSFTLLPLPGGS
ncbi:hypothetical protein NL676_034301 [Syzygium grande]|nr:hypothetical protein NL676_034301 [Syzygium grande]